jgi:hypothetical protein
MPGATSMIFPTHGGERCGPCQGAIFDDLGVSGGG